MARGRKALSDEQRALRGNAGKRKPKAPAPAMSDELIEKPASRVAHPSWLRPFPDAVKLWRDEAVPIIGQLRFIKSTDHHGLARWCYWLSVFIFAAKVIKREGPTQKVKTVSGDLMIRRHPLVRDRYEAERHLETLEASLGLNPKRRLEISQGIAAGGDRLLVGGANSVETPREPNRNGDEVPNVVDFFRAGASR